jgi:excisionase family DNA binding protein
MAPSKETEYISIREAARRLKVHENTIRNWADTGRLHPVVPPGQRYRKLDAAEVAKVALELHGVVSTMGESRRALGLELVDATLLDAWADRIESRNLFPKLLRALISANSNRARISARSGDGVDVPGWDALVTGASGSAWVPAGNSAWEFGTGADPARKAQQDFRKRTKEPLGVDPAFTTFVFATPRRWREARDWERKRNQERSWSGVRVIDADDLETWLESTPSVRVWISEQLGLRPRHVATAVDWFRRFAAGTRPPLPPSLLLAGREREAAQLSEAIGGAPQVLGLQAGSRDEALAFLAAAWEAREGSPADGDEALVVWASDVWERLVAADAPTVLVPMFDGADVVAAQDAGHHVVVPLGPADVPKRGATVITLPPTDRTEARQALERDAEMPFDRADRAAGLARRSLLSLRRALAVNPRAVRPPWAEERHAEILATLVLVGSWAPREADQEVVATATGRDWVDVERELYAWASSEDPPFINAGGIWRLVAPEEAYSILEASITPTDIARWEEVAFEVLAELDPSLELSPEKRPFAGLEGAVRLRSNALRHGMAQGLALLGCFGERRFSTRMTGREHAELLVQNLLRSANDDTSGHRWFSLSDELPMLAEAAPQVFLEAVDVGLAGDSPLLTEMFQDQAVDPLFTSRSPHTGLLWALEKLAWSSTYLVDATLALARLAEVDPGGKLGNRPPASLRAIFLPWIPRTSAPLEARITALDALRTRHPSIAWRLTISLLPRRQDTSSPTSKPVFQDWLRDREGVSAQEWLDTIAVLVDRAIEDAGTQLNRWGDLIEHVGNLPEDKRDQALSAAEKLDPKAHDDAARLELWRRLTNMVGRHRSFPNAEWAMDAASLKRLEQIASRVEPEKSPERFADLFGWHPTVVGVDRRDHDAYEKAVESRRTQAVSEVLATDGLDGLKRLATDCQVPGFVGAALAEISGADAEEAMLPLLGTEHGALPHGWLVRMAEKTDPTWLEEIAERARNLSEDGQVAFLLTLPRGPRSWELAETFSPTITEKFWKLVPAFTDAENLDFMLEKLVEHRRVWAAIDLLAMHCVASGSDARPDPALVERMLREALLADPQDDPSVTLTGHEIGALLDYLQHAGCSQKTLAELEWAYFPAHQDMRVPAALYEVLGAEPAFYVQLVSLVYRGKSQRPRKLDERETLLANRAWEVLDAWRTPPGQDRTGSIDPDALSQWVRTARNLLAETDRADIGDEQIGQLLSGSLPGHDGAWPAEAVRDVIETIGSSDLDNGLHVGRMNSRGVTSRGVYEGGDQERSLSATYRRWAIDLRPAWPRTARILDRLAASYEREARMHDDDAAHAAAEG